jgi:hypothetical protein
MRHHWANGKVISKPKCSNHLSYRSLLLLFIFIPANFKKNEVAKSISKPKKNSESFQ